MRHLWVCVLGTFLVAFAFTCPLFLFMRERHLQRVRSGAPGQSDAGRDGTSTGWLKQ